VPVKHAADRRLRGRKVIGLPARAWHDERRAPPWPVRSRGRGGCRVGSRAHQQLPGESLDHGTSSTDAPPTQGWPEGVSPRTFGGLSSADGLFVGRARTAAIVVGCFDRG
jgi:hypothetical protein